MTELIQMQPKYITTAQAQARYSIGKTTLFSLFHMDECPKIGKIGNQLRIPTAEFDKFFEDVIMGGEE